MIALLLLLSAATRVQLVDEVYRIPANQWRYVEVTLRQRPALVDAEYEARDNAPEIRVALLRRPDLDRLRDERPHGVLAATPQAASGRLRYQVSEPGDYAVVVDNGGDRPASVRLAVRLDFGARPAPGVTMLPRRRQLTVILISFAVFFGIVTWSARRLLRAIKREQ